MKDLMGMMKQVGEMQARFKEMQEELGRAEIDGQSGGGLVRLTVDGKGEVKRVRIDPSLMKSRRGRNSGRSHRCRRCRCSRQSRYRHADQNGGDHRRSAVAARAEVVLKSTLLMRDPAKFRARDRSAL